MSVKSIYSHSEGDWINDEIMFFCSDLKEKKWPSGGRFWECVMTDTQDLKVKAKLTSNTPMHGNYEGSVVILKGAGIKRRSDFNGTAQVQVGQTGEFERLGSTVGVQAAEQRQSVPTNVAGSASNVGQALKPIEGITVGMAVNCSVQLHCHGVVKVNDFGSVAESVEATAYQLAQAALRLQEGQVPVLTRYGAVGDSSASQVADKARLAKPEPGPDGQAFNPSSVEEDVTF